MSLVGPRPERQYFIDQIILMAPHYHHLHKVKPGITSWGQIKFGYAENVEQMVERMKFDILYIENMSLAMDIKILFYTVLSCSREEENNKDFACLPVNRECGLRHLFVNLFPDKILIKLSPNPFLVLCCNA